MCTTDIYQFTYPDGHQSQSHRPVLCQASRHGRPCSDNAVFQHPPQYVQHPRASSGTYTRPVFPGPSPYVGYPYPPTPPASYTPRSSTPVFHLSGDDTDHSYRSSSSRRRHRRSTGGGGVYVNTRLVADFSGQQRSTHVRHESANRTSRSPSRQERPVFANSPPTPRTPPRTFIFPQTAPSSPGFYPPAPYTSEAPSASRGPVIVNERRDPPFVQVEVDRNLYARPAYPSHNRHSSTSSRGSSRLSYSSAADADEDEHVDLDPKTERAQRYINRQKRESREAEKERRQIRELNIKDQHLQRLIDKANAEIARRPVVPMPPLARRSSTTGATIGDSKTRSPREPKDREAEMTDRLRKVSIREKGGEERQVWREHIRREQSEDEAQKARLRERTTPSRRTTIGSGNRRHRVSCDDGMYRWE